LIVFKPSSVTAPIATPTAVAVRRFLQLAIALSAASQLVACATGGIGARERPVGEYRTQDGRVFTVDTASLPFGAVPDSTIATDRWTGTLNGAGYRIEVPANWNGKLVMYAHGYAGTGAMLKVRNPPIRRYLIEQGYAWAASSYSRNYYDVRAAIEDTNALALAFTGIARQNGRNLAAPSRTYIAGMSMGGYTAVAAVEEETLAMAKHKVRYDGATTWCAALSPTGYQDYFAAYQLAAMKLAGHPATRFPVTEFESVRPPVMAALFTNYPAGLTAKGRQLYDVVQELSGGPRPIFAQGWAYKPSQDANWGIGFSRESWDGMVTRPFQDTTRIVYQLDADLAQSAEEKEFNRTILRAHADPALWNPPRPEGLRWSPRVNGEIANVPVVTLSNLGDLYMPFVLSQEYNRAVNAKGRGQWLVQRTARSIGHCKFTAAERVATFKATVDWAENKLKPDGDDVLNRAVVADPKFGCKFTINTGGQDDSADVLQVRAKLPSCS
jgi:hypothetical protein